MNFKKLTKTGLSHMKRFLGEPIIYTSDDTGLSKTIMAIMDNNTVEIDPSSGETILTDRVTAMVNSDDVDPQRNDLIEYENILYVVLEIEHDTHGSIKLLLEKEEYA